MTLGELSVTIIVGIVTLLLGALISRHYALRSRLTVYVPSLFNLVSMSSVSSGKVSIVSDGRPLYSLWVIRAIVRNDGNHDITEKLVRSSPSLDLGPSAKIIDVLPVHISPESRVDALPTADSTLAFQISYLKRGSYSGFQVIVTTPQGGRIDAADLSLDPGLIENTKVKLDNVVGGFVPNIMRYPTKWLMRRNAIVPWAGYLLALAMVAMGAFVLIAPYIPESIRIGIPFCPSVRPTVTLWTRSLIPVGIFGIVYGAFLFLYSFYLQRRVKYLNLFREEDTPDET